MLRKVAALVTFSTAVAHRGPTPRERISPMHASPELSVSLSPRRRRPCGSRLAGVTFGLCGVLVAGVALAQVPPPPPPPRPAPPGPAPPPPPPPRSAPPPR